MIRSFQITALVVIALCVVSCATAPKHYEFNPVASIDADFDTVWRAVVEYFAVTNLPIDTIEKDSGLIVTSWMDASKNGIQENKQYCDCGGAGLSVQHWTRGRFSIFVKPAPGGGTDLRVTCTYQQRRELMDTYSTVNCTSTGFLESQIHDYVRAKVAGTPMLDLPSFKPGQAD